MIGLPLALGAVQLTVAWPSPAEAVTVIGAPGSPAGMTALELIDSGPLPEALVACTVNVYEVPLVRLSTVA